MTAAATQFDMDNDGDLDLVTHTVNGPIVVFRNNAQTGQAIAFKLRDGLGNHFGIGAKISITLGTGQTQSRELQLGGGFMSFDAPIVYFGLGAETRVTKAVVDWADGTQTPLSDLRAGAVYQVTRQ